jgi:diamine N-acetyltransferase
MLEGKYIRLRPVEPSDIDFIYAMENDADVWRVSNTLVPYSRFQIEQYVLSPEHDIYTEKQLRLIIETVDPDNAKPVGAIDLFDFSPHDLRAGLGILIIPEERRKGFAGETIGILKKYCFEVLNLHQIHCSISKDNPASLNLFLDHGFEETGTRKDWRLLDGKWMDEIVLQLIHK